MKARESIELIVGAVIGAINQPESIVAGLYRDGTLVIAGRSVPLTTAQSRSLAKVLTPSVISHPWPDTVASNRFGAGRDRVLLTKVEPLWSPKSPPTPPYKAVSGDIRCVSSGIDQTWIQTTSLHFPHRPPGTEPLQLPCSQVALTGFGASFLEGAPLAVEPGADNEEMVERDVERLAIIQEMDDRRATLQRLLSSADAATLRRRSNGTRWTNEQLLFHMVFGYMVVRALLVLVRIFGRLPEPVSRGFAAMLNFVTTPFHVVNYWGSKLGALIFNRRRMGAQLDRVVASLQRHLRRESAHSLALSMSFPTRWDPFFKTTLTLAEVYHYPTQHFDFHRRQLSGPLAPND